VQKRERKSLDFFGKIWYNGISGCAARAPPQTAGKKLLRALVKKIIFIKGLDKRKKREYNNYRKSRERKKIILKKT
jgi:hypothetical protein